MVLTADDVVGGFENAKDPTAVASRRPARLKRNSHHYENSIIGSLPGFNYKLARNRDIVRYRYPNWQ
jgi:hypothetical protein